MLKPGSPTRLVFTYRGHDVEIERFTYAAGFFGAIEYSNTLHSGRKCLNETFDRKWPIQPDLYNADILAALRQMLNRLLRRALRCIRTADSSGG